MTPFYNNEGVLAGLWPCGIITSLSEGKSQVYGNVYAFLYNNSISTLSKSICNMSCNSN